MRKSLLAELPKPGLLASLRLGPGRPADDVPATGRRPVGRGDQLTLTEVRGNLTFTATTVTAWFTAAEQVWPFVADTDRETVMESIAAQYATLGGLRLRIRRTTVPFPVASWARTLSANAMPLPHHFDPTAEPEPERILRPGEPVADTTWHGHLGNAARWLTAGDYSYGRTQIGVVLRLPPRMRRGADGLDKATAERLSVITEDMAMAGLGARPSTLDEMLWMIYRSVGIGLSPPTFRPGNVGPDDIAEFVDNVDYERTKYGQTTQLTDRRTGQRVHVAVMTVGRMETLSVPQVHQPWMHLATQMPYDVELSSTVDILGPAASRGSLEHRLRMIRNQQRDYAEHNQDAPPELERLALRAAAVGDEIDTGLPVDSCRAHGHHRIAVHGATVDECMARVRDLARVYADRLHITLVHPKRQWELLRSITPGEDEAQTGYLRRMPVRMLAAGMPQASATVGDHRGDLIGHTATSGNQPVFFDLHFPMEVREESGLSVMVAKPGGGKSTLMGALGYLAVRRGVQVTLMDPSGPLARLCEMPELRPYSRVINLTGSQRGTLAPYAMIPTPRRGDFPAGQSGQFEYDEAVAAAEAERAFLVQDIVQMLLPPYAVDDQRIMLAVSEALRRVPAHESATLDDVVAVLNDMGADDLSAKTAAGMLTNIGRMPMARLFFGTPPPGTLDTDAALTVITMAGLRLPDPSIERKYWSAEELLALPMLHLAHRLAVRRAYSGDPHSRKFVGLDETHFMNGWGSGRAFVVRLARDSRKWNIAAMLASQNPADILELAVQNLVSTVFVGRIAGDPEIAAEALRLLGVPTGGGYEATLAALSQQADTSSTSRLGYREFVMRDVDGRVQKIRVDLSWVPGLLRALNTTPGDHR